MPLALVHALSGRPLLGGVVGESLGYLATALFTILAVRAFPGRPISPLGTVSAALIAGGVFGADLANFVGYLAWSGWLVVLAVALRPAGRPSEVLPVRHGSD